MNPIKSMAKRAMRAVFGDYRINWIFAISATGAAAAVAEPAVVAMTPEALAMLLSSASADMRKAASFTHIGLPGLVLLEQGQPRAVAHFADAQAYDRAATWPLPRSDIALIDIVTDDAWRGRGLAARLLDASTAHWLAGGTRRVIAFVWWNNRPSLHLFECAGWRRIGFAIEICPRGRWLSLRVPLARNRA